MNLAGKTALITGASRGIGRAIAVEFARSGADVALIGRDVAALQETADACAAARPGAVAVLYEGDVTDKAAIERIVDEALQRLGRIDCAIANAGQSVDALLLRLKPETIDHLLHVNLKSAFYLCGAVAKPMMKQRSGSIVLMTSIVGMTGNAGPSRVRGFESGAHRALQIAGKGVGFEEYKSQRRRAGSHRDRHDREDARRRQGVFDQASRSRPRREA